MLKWIFGTVFKWTIGFSLLSSQAFAFEFPKVGEPWPSETTLAAFFQGAINGGTPAPTPPSIAAAYGLTSRTFYDPFTSLSTIDVNNTGNSGYKWYVECNFSTNWLGGAASAGSSTLTVGSQSYGPTNYLPNGAQIQNATHPSSIPTPTYVVSGGGSAGSFTLTLSQNITSPGISANDVIVANYPPQPANTLSIVTQNGLSALKMSNVGQTQSNYGIGTTYNIGGSNVNIIGFTTGQNKSFYGRVKAAFDESLAPAGCCTDTRWPANTSYSYPGTSGLPVDELDWLDFLPGGGGGTVALSYYIHELGGTNPNQVSYTNQGRGQVATFGSLTGGSGSGGSGYVNGTYTAVPLYDVNGYSGSSVTGLTANITVSGGVVTGVTLNTPGLRANSSETVTTPNSNLGGSGSGFQIPIATTTNLVFRDTEYHTWEVLYIVTGDNSGTGLYGWYFDGMFVGSSTSLSSSVQVTTGGVSSPASDNPQNGEFTAAQTNGIGFNMVINNGRQAGGQDWPLYIASYEVWQKP